MLAWPYEPVASRADQVGIGYGRLGAAEQFGDAVAELVAVVPNDRRRVLGDGVDLGLD